MSGKEHAFTACVPCRKSHSRCCNERPCIRCVRRGTESECVDVPGYGLDKRLRNERMMKSKRKREKKPEEEDKLSVVLDSTSLEHVKSYPLPKENLHPREVFENIPTVTLSNPHLEIPMTYIEPVWNFGWNSGWKNDMYTQNQVRSFVTRTRNKCQERRIRNSVMNYITELVEMDGYTD